MIRSRLSYSRFYLKILTLILPACAYFIAVRVRFGMNLFLPGNRAVGLPSYWGVVLLTTIAWVIAAEESGLWSIEQLYAPGGKSRRLLEAVGFTYVVVMAGGFLYRGASYSRIVIALSALALFILATLLRILFRVLLERARTDRHEVRIVVVGTDGYAKRVASGLTNGQVLPCRIVGYVRLPGQTIEVQGPPVFELDHATSSLNSTDVDDIVIAVPSERLNEINLLLPTLEKLCVPARMAIDLAPGIAVRDQLIDLGGIRMVDLRPRWRNRIRI